MAIKERKTLEPTLSSGLEQVSLGRLSLYCKNKTFSKVESIHRDKEVQSSHLSMILLWGEKGKIVFKTHYDLGSVRDWAHQTLGLEKETITKDQVIDFVNEYSNMLGGYLRGLLQNHGIQMGMSLPLSCLGDHERAFREINFEKYRTGMWQISDGDKFIYCSAETDIEDQETLKKLSEALNSVASKTDDEEGEIEFF